MEDILWHNTPENHSSLISECFVNMCWQPGRWGGNMGGGGVRGGHVVMAQRKGEAVKKGSKQRVYYDDSR